MAYADQDESGRRTFAIAVVLLLHLALAYAFITGLALNVIKKAASDLKTFDVTEPPPPPAPPPPPPQVPKNIPPPPIVSPPPIVQTPPISAPVMQAVPVAPPIIHPAAPVAPPAPPAPSQATAAAIKGDPNFGITDEDYPDESKRNNEQGTTRFSYDITADGHMSNCTIAQSSGSSLLDETTCRLAMRRARFKPAKDAAGNNIASTQRQTRSIRWVLPKD